MERDSGDVAMPDVIVPRPPPSGSAQGEQPVDLPVPPTGNEVVMGPTPEVSTPTRRRLAKAASAPHPLETGAASSSIPDTEATSAAPTGWVRGGGTGPLNKAILDIQAKLHAKADAIKHCNKAYLESREAIRDYHNLRAAAFNSKVQELDQRAVDLSESQIPSPEISGKTTPNPSRRTRPPPPLAQSPAATWCPYAAPPPAREPASGPRSPTAPEAAPPPFRASPPRPASARAASSGAARRRRRLPAAPPTAPNPAPGELLRPRRSDPAPELPRARLLSPGRVPLSPDSGDQCRLFSGEPEPSPNPRSVEDVDAATAIYQNSGKASSSPICGKGGIQNQGVRAGIGHYFGWSALL
nr:formin-like protein 5 [Aegilops tauschii subsp. strangulata]